MDEALRRLVDAIVANNRAGFSKMIDAFPVLATATFQQGVDKVAKPLGFASGAVRKKTGNTQIGAILSTGYNPWHLLSRVGGRFLTLCEGWRAFRPVLWGN